MELEKVGDLCKDFCVRYNQTLKSKLQSEQLLRLDDLDSPPLSPTSGSSFDWASKYNVLHMDYNDLVLFFFLFLEFLGLVVPFYFSYNFLSRKFWLLLKHHSPDSSKLSPLIINVYLSSCEYFSEASLHVPC